MEDFLKKDERGFLSYNIINFNRNVVSVIEDIKSLYKDLQDNELLVLIHGRENLPWSSPLRGNSKFPLCLVEDRYLDFHNLEHSLYGFKIQKDRHNELIRLISNYASGLEIEIIKGDDINRRYDFEKENYPFSFNNKIERE